MAARNEAIQLISGYTGSGRRAGRSLPEYRAARNVLLAEEIELRRHIERVAAQRRALPIGGRPIDSRSAAQS